MKALRRIVVPTVISLAMGILAFPAVSSAGNFTANSYPAAFTGTSSGQEFVLEAGKVECSTAHFSGTLTASSSSITIAAAYSGCKAFGFLEASVSMGSCDYVFNSFVGTWNINCTNPFAPITISASTCQVTIGSQSGLAPLSLANGSGGLWVGPETGSLAYTVTKDGFLCPFSGTGAKAGGDYVSVVDMFISVPGKTLDVG